MKFRRLSAGVAVGVLALALLLPARARADTCNGFVAINYPNLGPGAKVKIGDEVDVQIFLAAGSIVGGTILNVKDFFFNLACDVGPPPMSPFALGSDVNGSPNGCKDDPAHTADPTKPVQFVKGSLSGVTCNVQPVDPPDFGDGIRVGTPGLTLLKAPAPPLPIAFCTAQFKEKITGLSGDATKFRIEQLVGYHAASCDNGLLDSGNFQTAALDIEQEEENFNCYQIPRNVAGKPPICANCTPTLIDPFTAPAGVTLPVGRPHRLCAPADLTSEPNQTPANQQGDHLEGYDYLGAIQPSFSPKKVVVTNVFGTVTAQLQGTPDRLLVPTSKCSAHSQQPCTPQVPNPPSIHHFQCYKLSNPDGGGKSATGVTTDDQFGSLGPFGVSPGLRLCASVNKNGEDASAVTDPTFLLCYHGSPRFGSEDVDLANQFATLSTRIDNYDDLCVTSTVTLP